MVSWHKLVVGLSDPLLLSEFKGWFLFLTTDAANHHHGVWNSSRVQSLSYVIASNKDSTAGALLTVDNDAWSTLPSNSCVGFTVLAEVGLCSCQRGEQIWLRCMESCSVWAIFFFFSESLCWPEIPLSSYFKMPSVETLQCTCQGWCDLSGTDVIR